MEMQVKMPCPRPCLVHGSSKALFYGIMQNAWCELSETLTPVQRCVPSAIVEFESGQLGAVPLSMVRVLDSDEAFLGYCFDEGDE